jgi:para-nitrobenzyl esterase
MNDSAPLGLRWIALASALLASAGLAVAQTPTAPIVTTREGAVQGVVDGDMVSWKGVPFAAPPVGDLRWRAPQPATPWSNVRPAADYAPDCASNTNPNTMIPLRTVQSEDCLYLNVWRPAGSHGPLPVLVWIYGGGFTTGGTSPAMYDGANLARQGVVLVSINYRVGQFGFFAHPALAAEQAGEPRGNYGFLDQIAAMKWIRANVAAFGGDPKNVTVFGESAGGFSVHMLLMSPLAKGLVDKAIIESGGGRRTIMTGQRMSDDGTGKQPSAESKGLAWARSHGIEGTGAEALRRLRALPTATVLEGLEFSGPLYSGPMIDGTIMPYNMMTAYDSGRFAHVPLMIGTTSGDLSLNHARTKDEVFAAFGAEAARARAVYDPEGQLSLAELRSREGADEMMHETARFTARRFAAAGLPVYLYRFGYVATAKRPSAETFSGTPNMGATTGAFHATDIPFVFDTVPAWLGDSTTASDEATARMMSAYWVAFARTGNPNGPGRPDWSRYGPRSRDLLLVGDEGTHMASDPWQARLDVVETLNRQTQE